MGEFARADSGQQCQAGRTLRCRRHLFVCSLQNGHDMTDGYTKAVREVIDAVRKSHHLPEGPRPTARSGQPVDLMAALRVR